MKKRLPSILLLALSVVVLMLVACQPEVPPYNPTNRVDSNTTSTSQLSKYVVTNGSDSTILKYTYNTAKQVVGIELLEVNGATTNHYFYSYTRNAAGLITFCKYTYLVNNVPGPDTATVDFIYSTGTTTNLVTAIERVRSSIAADNRTDSTLYNYNAAGQCTAETSYSLDATSPTIYYIHQRYTYSYNSTGDVSESKYYTTNSNGQFALEDSTSMTYDSKSPFLTTTTAERFALYAEVPYANHNITQSLYKPATGTGFSPVTTVITHTYNSQNLPVTSKIVNTENGVVDSSFVKYYYQ